jgi:hypothetical protein
MKEDLEAMLNESPGEKETIDENEGNSEGEGASKEASEEAQEKEASAEEKAGEGDAAGETITLTRADYEGLMTKISDLASKIESGKSETKRDEAKKEEVEQKLEDKDVDFLGNEKLDDILGDPQKVNALLNKLRRATRDETSAMTRESVLRSIPEVVKSSVSRFTAMREAVQDFYRENKDLVPHKKYLGIIANEVATENPDKELKWIFDKAAERTRKALKLAARKEEKAEDKSKKPTLPGGSRSASRTGEKAGKLTGKAAEIDEMLSSTG